MLLILRINGPSPNPPMFACLVNALEANRTIRDFGQARREHLPKITLVRDNPVARMIPHGSIIPPAPAHAEPAATRLEVPPAEHAAGFRPPVSGHGGALMELIPVPEQDERAAGMDLPGNGDKTHE